MDPDSSTPALFSSGSSTWSLPSPTACNFASIRSDDRLEEAPLLVDCVLAELGRSFEEARWAPGPPEVPPALCLSLLFLSVPFEDLAALGRSFGVA